MRESGYHKQGARVEALVVGVLAGERAAVGRAITLVESSRAEDQRAAQEMLEALLPHTGKAHRIGVTGVPGVGKSTLLEALGTLLTAEGKRVAVLAIDPTSSRSGGSILGDKTRMNRLATDERAFVRPSPSSGTLGGVAQKTRESMLVCEAAGFDVVFVETVGVGQSEARVAEMVDTFLLLLLAGAGDQLQGIKRGILELADVLCVTKDDGDNRTRVATAAADTKAALRFIRPRSSQWMPVVMRCSALAPPEEGGVDRVWERLAAHWAALVATGELDAIRREQRRRWMWQALDDQLGQLVRQHPRVLALLPAVERGVLDGTRSPAQAAQTLLDAFRQPS